jgi:glycosyltransferase involved in cell wall biosynthesis
LIRVLHVIKVLSGTGGSSRAACDIARAVARAAPVENRIVSLLPALPGGARLAGERGLALLDTPAPAALRRAVAAADILHVHWWNDPGIYRFLMSDLPAARLLLFVHVAGDVPPNVLIPELVEAADLCVAGCPYVLGCPALRDLPPEVRDRKVAVVTATGDFSRLAGIADARRDDGSFDASNVFNVGYIGAVDFKKMHPEFVAMSARARIPEARFVVCGQGHVDLLARQARELGVAARFDFRGHVEDVAPVLAGLDVFGYPLCANPGAELAVQEAMTAGVPPVVFGLGGLRDAVQHGTTGLVVGSEEEYTRALEHLHADAGERRRLGANARDFAARSFGAESSARRLLEVYRELLRRPKRRRRWPGEPASGAALFARSLGEAGEPFWSSLRGAGTANRADRAGIETAEQRIASSSRLMLWGLARYCEAFPRDPHLRLWHGLVQRESGEAA